MTSKTDLTNLGEVISTDVLIMGGGISGLLAAIKAKLARPAVSVLVVDKATPGYAGQGPVSGGFSGFVKEGGLDEFLKWKVEAGGYLNDQEYAYAYYKDSYKVNLEMADLGAPLTRDEKGELIVRSFGAFGAGRGSVPWPSALDTMQFLKGKARSEGVRILPRIFVVELLTKGERVAGAVGFSIDNGQFYILKAKATILANGGCTYRYRTRYRHNSGVGVAMAYNVGAEMRNAEFANCVTAVTKDGLRGCRVAFEPAENANGENIPEKYGVENSWDFTVMVPLMQKEIQEGRGPIYSNEGRHDETPRVRKKLGMPLDQKVEIKFGVNGRLGPIRVGPHCRATLPGLWAVGDASFGGSALEGAVPPCSAALSGIPNAEITGCMAGPDAADFAAEAAAPQIDSSQVSRLKEQIYAPLEREAGFDPNDAIYQVQEAIIPTKYSVFRSEERMQEALAMIEEVKGRLPTLWAKDLHYLVKAHEAKSMALCAEITHRPALMRQESRGFHMREDYPERDDQNWLKWIIIKKEKEGMKLWTEPVPIDKYKIKPPEKA
ncbi:FAD-binding protein [Chloroflexota bacterium]